MKLNTSKIKKLAQFVPVTVRSIEPSPNVWRNTITDSFCFLEGGGFLNGIQQDVNKMIDMMTFGKYILCTVNLVAFEVSFDLGLLDIIGLVMGLAEPP